MKVNNKLFFVFALVFSLTLAVGGLFAAHADTPGATASQGRRLSQSGAGLAGSGQGGAVATVPSNQSHKHVTETPARRWFSSGGAQP